MTTELQTERVECEADRRAREVEQRMTDDERFSLVISVLGAVPGSTGFERVQLQPGESQRVALSADPRLLARFDGSIGAWRIAEGSYAVAVGRSAASLDLTASTALGGATFGV